MNMNIPALTTDAIQALHSLISQCLECDDALPAGAEKHYGVRQYPDWREESNQLETELDRRKIPYTKIAW